MRLRVLSIVFLLAAACGGEPARRQTEATPRPISSAAVRAAVLSAADMGGEWTPKSDASFNTVQIGGRIGAANISNPPAQATTAFDAKSGSGFVSNSVFLMGTNALARAVIDAHEQAASTTSWTQTRKEGGKTDWKIAGSIAGLDPPVGEQMFATHMRASITEASGAKTERTVEYVVYRIDRLVGFIVAQDTAAAPFARKQAAKVERVADGSTP